MTIHATQAAHQLLDEGPQATPHRLIALLMDGGLERAAQAKQMLEQGDAESAELLIAKLRGILQGLRDNLNLESGGDIADRLDSLYDYMMLRVDSQERVPALDEVSELLCEVKKGWEGIA